LELMSRPSLLWGRESEERKSQMRVRRQGLGTSLKLFPNLPGIAHHNQNWFRNTTMERHHSFWTHILVITEYPKTTSDTAQTVIAIIVQAVPVPLLPSEKQLAYTLIY
jgi:hypothetical protein